MLVIGLFPMCGNTSFSSRCSLSLAVPGSQPSFSVRATSLEGLRAIELRLFLLLLLGGTRIGARA